MMRGAGAQVLQGAGGQVAGSKVWVRVCLERMCEAGMVTAGKKQELINYIGKVLH
jgi:hypothetical protein